jgi:hypothetical protein
MGFCYYSVINTLANSYSYSYTFYRLLIYTALVTPFRTAFYQVEQLDWIVIDAVVDFIFAIDLFCNFFFAYFDSEYNLITKRSLIMKKYVLSWFLVDLVSIIPINFIIQSGKDYGSLARIARLPRLYRLIKMTKLARMLKIIKERNKLFKYLNDHLKLSTGVERLIYVIFIFLLMIHITSCLWYLLATFEENNPKNWVSTIGFQDQSIFEVSSSYFSLFN